MRRWLMIDLTAFLALVLDAAVGWPQPLYRRIGHPVGIFARIIAALERRWNVPSRSDGQRRMAGAVTVLILLLPQYMRSNRFFDKVPTELGQLVQMTLSMVSH